jgi:hypothetical protein
VTSTPGICKTLVDLIPTLSASQQQRVLDMANALANSTSSP